MRRLSAVLVVVSLVSPALGTIACDLACALGAADAPTASMNMATCHEHHARHSGTSVTATSSGLCHDSGDTPAAVLADMLQWTAIPAGTTGARLFALARLVPHAVTIDASRSSPPPPLISPLRI